MVFPPTVSAYNVVIDVGTQGNTSYSYPAVLGDEDKKEEEKKEDKKEEKREEQKPESRPEEKREDKKPENRHEPKPSHIEPRPVKIEVKKSSDAPKVKLINRNKSVQELSPEKVEIRLPSAPKKPELEVKKEVEKEKELRPEVSKIEDRDHQENEDDTNKTLKERTDRKFEKVEIQSEVHDDGSVELQVESRNIKAKVKTDQIDVDVANSSIGTTKQSGEGVDLIHLPDQAMQKFIDRGLSTVPDTLEIGQSGDSLEYSVRATKSEKLFGFIPRQTKYKMTMDDQNGAVTEQKVSDNVVDKILNLFSF